MKYVLRLLLICCAIFTVLDDLAAEEGVERAVQYSLDAIVTSSLPSTYVDSTTGMEFVLVPGGCFQMGNIFANEHTSGGNILARLFWFLELAAGGDTGEPDEIPVHEVCVESFYMGKNEVTQAEYKRVVKNNPSRHRGDRHPVEMVSWHDAQAFTSRFAELSGKDYQLPTEAQWEYAARSGGLAQIYAGGNNIDTVAWNDVQERGGTHPVGQKKPNGLGLYDMSGNVWEWCRDWYGQSYYKESPRLSPLGPSSGTLRVLRGGSWNTYPRQARTVNRRFLGPESMHHATGFRIVAPIAQVPDAVGR